ncbi:MAG: hypothetical protein PHR36_02105 [Patescibacteria group bacterium]|nr:hypothetical protein [Patescibacteria group bacterium]
MEFLYLAIFYGSYFIFFLFVYFIIKFWKKNKKVSYLLIIILLFFSYARFVEPYLIVVKNFSV